MKCTGMFNSHVNYENQSLYLSRMFYFVSKKEQAPSKFILRGSLKGLGIYRDSVSSVFNQ